MSAGLQMTVNGDINAMKPETLASLLHLANCAAHMMKGNTNMNNTPIKITHAEWLAQGNPKPLNITPRRCSIPNMCPAELAIREAIMAVEGMGASPELTAITEMLSEAQIRVADVVDNIVDRRMAFPPALRMIKSGRRVARMGWNGKGMFLFLVHGSTFTVNREPLKSILGEGTSVDYRPHIDLRDAEGKVVPWVPSQADLMASDWVEVT